MKIMTIYAHPADTITNCGGTLARHADAGDEITAVILTHGGRIHANKYAEEWRKENPDTAITEATLDDIIANKKAELHAAAKIIGIDKVITLDHDDTMASVHEDVVTQVSLLIAEIRPDVVICDYPQNAVVAQSSHTIATMTALAAIEQATAFVPNIDGTSEFEVRQIFMTGNPTTAIDALSTYGQRNDTFIDITPVVGRKLEAMDCFTSQGYHGNFARKLVEASNGEYGRAAGTNFAEAYVRFRNETHDLLPLTQSAKDRDHLTRHLSYSTVNLRAEHPVT